ncbi:MAG TPA: alpha/beta hydrolase, partial [Longimicrobiales bacterium]
DTDGQMPNTRVNGVGSYWEERGAGQAMVLVHGSWGDHNNWARVVPGLAEHYRVVTYDRRGHSRSERPPTQGSLREDAQDLAALLQELGTTPAHVVGNSGGAAVALTLAAARPELFGTLMVHEPPLFALLAGDDALQGPLAAVQTRVGAVIEKLEGGDDAGAARLFVETIAFGPGAWAELPEDLRQTFIGNAPTFLDETRDPDGLGVDLEGLRRFDRPTLLSQGESSPPFFPAVIRKLAAAIPQAQLGTFAGAGHVPHLSHPAEYVARVREFVEGVGGE